MASGAALFLFLALSIFISPSNASLSALLSSSTRQFDDCQIGAVCFALNDRSAMTQIEYGDQRGFVIAAAITIASNTEGTLYAAAVYADVAEGGGMLTDLAKVIQPSTKDIDMFTAAVLGRARANGVRTTAHNLGLSACAEALGAKGTRTIVLITDSTDDRAPTGVDAAASFKAKGFNIVTIGIGPQVDVNALQSIANSAEFAINVNSFSALNTAVNPLLTDLCALGAAGPPIIISSPSVSSSASPVLTPSVTPTVSAVFMPEAMPSATTTATASASATPSVSSSASPSVSQAMAGNPSATATPSITSTALTTPSVTPSTSTLASTVFATPSPSTNLPPTTSTATTSTASAPETAPIVDDEVGEVCSFAFSQCSLTFMDPSGEPSPSLLTFFADDSGRLSTSTLASRNGSLPGEVRGRIARAFEVSAEGRERRLRGGPFVVRGTRTGPYAFEERGERGKRVVKALKGGCVRVRLRFVERVRRGIRRFRRFVGEECVVFRVM